MSPTAKVLIGCAILAVAAVVLIVVIFGSIGWFIDRQLADAGAGFERQAEVTRSLNQLEDRHDFSPPADGVIGDTRAQRFFAVTDDTWEETRAWADDLERRTAADEGRRVSMRDALGALGGLGRARVSLAEALERHDMPTSEYLWTGLALLRAHDDLNRPPGESGVPAENLDLARQHDDRLREIGRGEEEGRFTRGSVFVAAMTLGMTSERVRQFSGWDTLHPSAP